MAFIHLAFILLLLLILGCLYSFGFVGLKTDVMVYNSSLLAWISEALVTCILVTAFLMEYSPLETAISSSAERFRTIFESVNDAIIIYNPQTGTILEANQRMYEHFGYTKDEVQQINFEIISEGQTPYTHTEAMQYIRKAESGSAQFFEWHARHKDGHLFWIEVSMRKVIIDKEDRILVSIHDISARKAAIEALYQSENRTRSIFDRSPIAIGIGKQDSGIIVEVNNAWLTLFGYQRHEVIGKTANELNLYFNNNERAELVRNISEHGQIVNCELLMRRKSGEILDILYSAELITLAGESLLQVMMTNITERKHAEDKLKKSEEKYAKAFIAFPELITIASMVDGRQIEVNDQFLLTSGYCRTEVIGHTSTELGFWTTPEDRLKFIDDINKYGRLRNYEFQYRMRNGEIRDFSMSSEILVINEERCSINFLIDVTERKRSELEKAKLVSQLHQIQKMESIGSLAGGVAHDFNNMLTVIHGYSQLGLMEEDSSPAIHRYFEEILSTADRSAELTKQLLAFARKQTISPIVLDMNDTVSGMLKMLQRLIGEGIRLTWQPSPDLWLTKADPSQIDQILANLCVNARDAITTTGRITIETKNNTIGAEFCREHPDADPGEYVHLGVSDDGNGMDKETVEHVFEPFFTTKGIGEGTGLGLATVYGIVRQNNGFITVSSELGRGTTFSIHLPRYKGESAPNRKEESYMPAPFGLETILIVEDDLAILNMASMILSKQGYTVLSAITTAEAIRLAEVNSDGINLLITDVIMPEMNGKELTQKLQSLYPSLKSLYMSGYTADSIAKHGALEEGVNFIQKPFSVPVFATKVREVLDGK
jgi:PAS domain S-box-containing protein